MVPAPIHRPHPSSLLLGCGYSSDITGDGPPPPSVLPAHLRESKDHSSSVWKWDPMSLHLLALLPHRSRVFQLVARFISKTHETFFRGQLGAKYLEGSQYQFHILHHCHYSTLADSCSSGSLADAATLQLLLSTSMDDLLLSWRSHPPFSSSYGALWNQYLTYLSELGPFGGECWITVHSSLSWLLDPAFIDVPPSAATIQLRWSQMRRLRIQLASHVNKLIQSLPPTISPAIHRIIEHPVPLVAITPVALSETPHITALRRQCPKQLRRKRPLTIVYSLLVGRSKQKKRRHRKRRMEFYRHYHRPPKVLPIFQILLEVTSIPDKFVNRSFGSSNSLDPPE